MLQRKQQAVVGVTHATGQERKLPGNVWGGTISSAIYLRTDSMKDDWQAVWTALSDQSLENRLRHYYWLTTVHSPSAAMAPNIYRGRFAALVEEARRRGKPQMVEKAKQWVNRQNRLGFSPLP